MPGRGTGRETGGTRISAILVSAGVHLAAAAFVIVGQAEPAPLHVSTPTPRTAAITLLPPVAESAPAAKPEPPQRKAATASAIPAAPARPRVAMAAPEGPSSAPPIVRATAITMPPPKVAAPESAPPDADAIHDDYARRLWQWIAARRPQGLRLEGEAVVAFRVARSGKLSEIELVQTSGSNPLDRLALRTVRLSAPVPPPPEAVPDDVLRFSLTFHFR